MRIWTWIGLLLAFGVAAGAGAQVELPEPTPGALDSEALTAIDFDDYPVLPTWTDTAREIYAHGQDLARDPDAFAKVGDSVTAAPEFLKPLSESEPDFGDYEKLAGLLDQIDGDVFARESEAAAEGLLTVSVVDPMWAGADCEPNESPLLCEFRLLNPAYALVMFGTNDVMVLDAATYDTFLRAVVRETAAAGVVPIMSTFPPRPEDVEKSLLFNRVVVQISQDYDLPLINLLRALEPLPDYGVDPEDTLHLTAPPPPLDPVTFTEEGLKYGYNVRNLVTLQALDTLRATLDESESQQ